MPPLTNIPNSTSSAVEAPSGKSAETENFPVGSVILSKRLRPHVGRFYAFARAIDDIADAPDLDPQEKITRLDGFERTLEGQGIDDPVYAKATALRESLRETSVTTRHGVDLIAAFKQDAVLSRYRTWDDLMGYCALSAAPVGRYLVDLHGGSRSKETAASDALCAALQVINHLQDCKDDYREMDRVYLPLDWMEAEGATVEDLGREAATPAVRRVLDRCVAGTRQLMETARHLSADIKDPRLALEAGIIVQIAFALTDRLSREDPLASHIKLTKPQLLAATLKGFLRGLRAIVTKPPTMALPSPFANVHAREHTI